MGGAATKTKALLAKRFQCVDEFFRRQSMNHSAIAPADAPVWISVARMFKVEKGPTRCSFPPIGERLVYRTRCFSDAPLLPFAEMPFEVAIHDFSSCWWVNAGMDSTVYVLADGAAVRGYRRVCVVQTTTRPRLPARALYNSPFDAEKKLPCRVFSYARMPVSSIDTERIYRYVRDAVTESRATD